MAARSLGAHALGELRARAGRRPGTDAFGIGRIAVARWTPLRVPATGCAEAQESMPMANVHEPESPPILASVVMTIGAMAFVVGTLMYFFA
jgi:hypothetical protein